ncbi:MAG: ROK family protein [Clostridia bacterium]|nr:ROK family protein [Clostridia bacterium]
MLIGAIEAGGTNMIVSIGNVQRGVMQRASFPTAAPEETISRIVEFIRMFDVKALGIGSFGPLDLNPASATYGCITDTPKRQWKGYPLMPVLRDMLGVPAKIDTAANVCALAENRKGAGVGAKNMLYVAVGAGIGGGLIVGGKPLHGLVHPELGHMIAAPLEGDPMKEGVCPFHRHCLEGLASAPAMEKRWGLSYKLMSDDHPAWQLEAKYIAQLCANAITMFSPEMIVLGGEVMQHQPALYAAVRRETLSLLGGYIGSPMITAQGMNGYIVAPRLGINAGVTGALLLGAQALEEEESENE